MQLNKIEFLKNATTITTIKKGYSDAYKYLFTKKNKQYFLKIGTFQINQNLEKILTNHNISHPPIIEFKKYDHDKNYIIEEYIEGTDLKDEFDNHAPKFIYEYGFEIGQQYRSLRKTYPDKPMTKNKFQQYQSMIQERIEKLNSLIDNNISTADQDFIKYIISYLKNNIHIIKNSTLIFGHTDIKPSNYLQNNNQIIATDIENTDYSELSFSMRWSFARNDFKDEKNFAFTKGYLDALFNYNIPQNILNSFNYTYAYGLARHFIKYIEKKQYQKLTNFIHYVKTTFIQQGKLQISQKLKNHTKAFKNYDMFLIKGSYSPYNITLKCQNNKNTYFLKIMKMSKKHYKTALKSYQLLKKCNIPYSKIIKHGCIIKNKYYFTISNFLNLKEMDQTIENSFEEGFQKGQLVASYFTKLKNQKCKNIKTTTKKEIYNNIIQDINTIYGNQNHSDYLECSKTELINNINKYITSFDNEPIHMIHGDIKFGNILYDKNNIYFVDNESFQYSYDIMNFFYNIHIGFLEKQNLRYQGFVNGYIKYMNNGTIPIRIQNQAKLLFICYMLRTTKRIINHTEDESMQKAIINTYKNIDQTNWLA